MISVRDLCRSVLLLRSLPAGKPWSSACGPGEAVHRARSDSVGKERIKGNLWDMGTRPEMVAGDGEHLSAQIAEAKADYARSAQQRACSGATWKKGYFILRVWLPYRPSLTHCHPGVTALEAEERHL